MDKPTSFTTIIGQEEMERYPGDERDLLAMARWDEFRRKYREAERLILPVPGYPLQVDIETIAGCNLRCKFCINHTNRPLPHRMPLEMYRAVLLECAMHHLVSVKMNYSNEPLMDTRLPELIHEARDAGVQNVFLATNGILLDEFAFGALAGAGLTKLMVSIDAVSRETYIAVRGDDRFDQVVENTVKAIALKRHYGMEWPLIRVNFLRTPLNEHEEAEFERKWLDVADMVAIQTRNGVPGQMAGVGQGEGFGCSFPFKQVVVRANGDILPCCTFAGAMMPLGNIACMTIAEAWASPQMNELRELHASGKPYNNPICAYCIGKEIPNG